MRQSGFYLWIGVITSVLSAVMPLEQEVSPHRLIYVDSIRHTVMAYDPQTATHTPIFTCPEACYDPAIDERGRIALVSTGGFIIYDPIADAHTSIIADFGVYGYKGGAAFRSDLAYVAYEGRFDMTMRLLLTDLTTGETTDLFSAGVGNPAWSSDEQAVLVSDGHDLFIVPIDGTDAVHIPFMLEQADLFRPYDNQRWLFRGLQDGIRGLYVGDGDDATPIYADARYSALVTYAVTDTLAGAIVIAPRTARLALVIIDLQTGAVRYHLPDQPDMMAIALSSDERYVAWIAENADMGFGFYDLWLADLSSETITPIHIATRLSNPSARPSAVVWGR